MRCTANAIYDGSNPFLIFTLTRLVKLVNTADLKFVPSGYRFESDSEYL